MPKVIAVFNMTLDGVCDHTAGIPDPEIHHYYANLLKEGDAILYGRVTFQLMEYWRQFIGSPSEDESNNHFAKCINQIPKIVFSNTLKEVNWQTAHLASLSLSEEVRKLKQQANTIYVGSRSLIIQLLQLQLIDELQLLIYPVLSGRGMRLFEESDLSSLLNLKKVKAFNGGAIVLYYSVVKSEN